MKYSNWRHSVLAAAVAIAAYVPALGAGSKLSYHEAIVAQGAREMLATGDWLIPRIGGRPWLEKPPLSHWLVASVSAAAGGVNETTARLPSVLGAWLLALGVGLIAARSLGPRLGLAAAVCQLTIAWSVTRGRLADCDMLLASLVTWGVVTFQALCCSNPASRGRWAKLFWALIGATALVKGIGFGAALVGAIVVATLLVTRDRTAAGALVDPLGIALAFLIALAWPLRVLATHPDSLKLWVGHMSGRFGAATFAAEPLWQYATWPLVALLPWTPFAVIGAYWSAHQACSKRDPFHRLLWLWCVVPALLVSSASARNSHYLLPALAPASIWAAMGLDRVMQRIRARLPSDLSLRPFACAGALAVAGSWGVSFALIGPYLDARGKGPEWTFYERVAAQTPHGMPLTLVYDAFDRTDRWDRAPYETPWGPVPPDLAARLFYLGRTEARVEFGQPRPHQLRASAPSTLVIARARDRPTIESAGRVSILAKGPTTRPDRSYIAYMLEPTNTLPIATRLAQAQAKSGQPLSHFADGHR